jgi:hypothetical protein
MTEVVQLPNAAEQSVRRTLQYYGVNSARDLPAALRERLLQAQEDVLPCRDREAIAVLMDETIGQMVAGRLWVRPGNWPELSELFVDTLEELPLDLVSKALRAAVAKLNFFPKPAELRAFVEDDMTARRRRVSEVYRDVRIWKDAR